MRSKTNLTIGRGRLFFNPFVPGTQTPTAEFYIGNTPAFSVTRTVENVKRVRSIGGLKVSSAPVMVSENYSASFTTDNINHENVAKWFGSYPQDLYPAGGVVLTNFVYRNSGTFNLSDAVDYRERSSHIVQVQATVDGRAISIDQNFDLSDAKYGRIYVRPEAPDVFEGTSIAFRIVTREHKAALIVSEYVSVRGSLRFLSKNPIGSDFEYSYPVVELTPSGAIDLKSDDFQSLTFNVDILKRDTSTPHQIIRVLDKLSADENFLIDAGVPINEFLNNEDLLNAITNIRIPESSKVPASQLSFPRR